MASKTQHAVKAKAPGSSGRRKRRTPQSPEERRMWALGCELWRAGRDMSLASSSLLRGEITAVGSASSASSGSTATAWTTSHLPTILQLGGMSLQDAGAALLDARCSLAIQQLERAAETNQEYWPRTGFQGLLNFLRSIPVSCPGESLENLAGGLDVAMDAIDEQIQYPHRERAEVLLLSAADILRDAAYLFDPSVGNFSLPKDPRVVGVHFHDDDDDFWEEDDDFGSVNDQLEYISGDMAATLRIREIQKDLVRADNSADPNGRKKLLFRLVRENHPDQNPGKEEDVRPVLLGSNEPMWKTG